MLFGCCTNMLPKEPNSVGFEYVRTLQELGYDYVELPLGQVNLLSNQDFDRMRRELEAMHFPVRACNNFLTADLKLVGHRTKREVILDFVKRAMDRAEAMGTKYVIFGSPWSKECPDGVDRSEAFRQLTEWCQVFGDIAKEHHLVIGLEPNNRTETNMINTFQDVVDLSMASGHPNIRCLQDYFHLKMENDTVDSLLKYGREYLVHTHFARLEKRSFPVDISEDSYYRPYFEALHTLGYEGGISMEGFPVSKETFREEAEKTLKFFHENVK